MIALVAFSAPLKAKEKKEKWFGAGVKPDPTLTIPFIGVKAPIPTACIGKDVSCLLYTSPSPRDVEEPRMPSSA